MMGCDVMGWDVMWFGRYAQAGGGIVGWEEGIVWYACEFCECVCMYSGFESDARGGIQMLAVYLTIRCNDVSPTWLPIGCPQNSE